MEAVKINKHDGEFYSKFNNFSWDFQVFDFFGGKIWNKRKLIEFDFYWSSSLQATCFIQSIVYNIAAGLKMFWRELYPFLTVHLLLNQIEFESLAEQPRDQFSNI